MSFNEDTRIRAAREAQFSRYVGVSSVAFLVWDMLIHLQDEIDYIWRGPPSWVQWAYGFIRHGCILVLGSFLVQGTNEHNRNGFTERSCYNFIIVETVVSFCLVIAVELVLFIRIYAIYGRSRSILFFVAALFIAECVTAAIAFAKSLPDMRYSIKLGCIVTHTPPLFVIVWIASLTFQTVLFILTLVRWFQSVRLTIHLGRKSVLFVFVRDGVWAYAVIFILLLLNLLMFKLRASPLAPLCFKWGLALTCFTGAHVLLNLRRLAKRSSSFPVITTVVTGYSSRLDVAFASDSRPELSTNMLVPTLDLDPPSEVTVEPPTIQTATSSCTAV